MAVDIGIYYICVIGAPIDKATGLDMKMKKTVCCK
jgi:hypothetical protein